MVARGSHVDGLGAEVGERGELVRLGPAAGSGTTGSPARTRGLPGTARGRTVPGTEARASGGAGAGG